MLITFLWRWKAFLVSSRALNPLLPIKLKLRTQLVLFNLVIAFGVFYRLTDLSYTCTVGLFGVDNRLRTTTFYKFM